MKSLQDTYNTYKESYLDLMKMENTGGVISDEALKKASDDVISYDEFVSSIIEDHMECLDEEDEEDQ